MTPGCEDAVQRLSARVAAAAIEGGTASLVEGFTTLEGGHSGLTYQATVVDGAGAKRRIVVKAAPEGRPALGRHDVLRQERLFRTLHGAPGVTVPAPLFSSAEDPPFFAMELVAGEALEPVLTPAADQPPPEVVAARAVAVARMLAAVHAVDPTATGEPVRSISDELDRWARTMAAVDPELIIGADDLLAGLRAQVPEPIRPGVVHGDYRLGNVLCDGSVPTAIIDWEIWCVTDPRLDLGWFLAHCDEATYPGIGHPSPGLPSADRLLVEYESASGGPVADRPWFDAYGRFKLAAIMGHNMKRHREGRHRDPFQEGLPPTIARLIKTGRDLVS